MKNKRTKQDISDAFLLMFAMIAGMAVIHIIISTFLSSMLARVFFTTVFGIGGVAFVINKHWNLPTPPLWLKQPSFGSAIMFGLGLALLGTGGVALEAFLFPSILETLAQQQVLLEPLLHADDPKYIPLVLLVVAISPGIFEEFAYRGVMRSRLKSLTSPSRIVFVGALFAAMHLNPVTFGPLFLIGILLTYFAELKKGWGESAIAHITLNAFNGVLYVRLPLEQVEPSLIAAITLPIGAIIVGGVIKRANVDLS